MKHSIPWNTFNRIYIYVPKTVLRRFIAEKMKTSYLSNTGLKYFVIFMGETSL